MPSLSLASALLLPLRTQLPAAARNSEKCSWACCSAVFRPYLSKRTSMTKGRTEQFQHKRNDIHAESLEIVMTEIAQHLSFADILPIAMSEAYACFGRRIFGLS